MAFPHYAYRDPLEQLIAAEGYTCKGCIHRRQNEFFPDVFACSLKNADGTPRKHGRRCVKYEEQGSNA